MATITNKAIIDQLIADNGYDEPLQAIKIVEYTNRYNGQTAWGVMYQGESPNRYDEGEFIKDPRTIWEFQGGMQERIRELRALVRHAENRVELYRLTAELEDIYDGNWSGPVTEDPPADWMPNWE